MGRELRRVPPNWEHPKENKPNFSRMSMEERYTPLHDDSCESAWEDWWQRYQNWLDGGHEEVIAEYGAEEYPRDQPYTSFCNYDGAPPRPEHYRPQWKDGEATWWQVYETVSEGTPVSPPFETQAELVEYLVENGDFWDQDRRKRGYTSMPCQPWTREQAEAFVYRDGHACSMVVADGRIMSGVEANVELRRDKSE